MVVTLSVLACGLFLLLVGGDALVRGAVAIATRLGVSPLVIGLTLVGFGTSAPELVASVQAALVGSPGIAVGNVVGSNIANILLVLGVAAVILPVKASASVLRRDGVVLLASALIFTAIALTDALGRWMGAVLLLALAVYTGAAFFAGRGEAAAAPPPTERPMRVPLALALVVGGIVGVVLGGDLLVRAAITLARTAGLSEAVIGLTVVAVGTSLPELATAVAAGLRRQGEVALGTVISSNIFNVLGIAGISAVLTKIPIPREILWLDVWVMLGASAVLVFAAATGRGITRRQGAALLLAYAGYLTFQFTPSLRGLVGL